MHHDILQVANNIEKSRLQLVGITALFIASKYEEVYPPDIGDYVYITDNTYSKTDLFRCEQDIMTKLDFRLSKPTPLQFLRRLVVFVLCFNNINMHPLIYILYGVWYLVEHIIYISYCL